MAKKHRVKRQKYVEYLLKIEKEREEYLKKRKRSKRTRQECNEGNVFAEARDDLVMGDRKRERKEPTVKDHSIVVPPNSDESKKQVDTFMQRIKEEIGKVDYSGPQTTPKPMVKRTRRRY